MINSPRTGLSARPHLVPQIAAEQRIALRNRITTEFPRAVHALGEMQAACSEGGRFRFALNGKKSSPELKKLMKLQNAKEAVDSIFEGTLAVKLVGKEIIFAKNSVAIENDELDFGEFTLKT